MIVGVLLGTVRARRSAGAGAARTGMQERRRWRVAVRGGRSRSLRAGHAVDAALVDDVGGPTGIVAELATELLHVGAHDLRIVAGPRAPRPGAAAPRRSPSARAPREHPEQLELGRGDVRWTTNYYAIPMT